MKTTQSLRRALCASLCIAALAMAGCRKAPDAPGGGQAPAPPAAPKALVVGTDAAYAPFESQNERGEIVGFDIDLVRAVAQKAGLEVKFVNTPWEGIFNALAQGDRDLLVSSITITEERKQTLDFSDPYFDAHQLIAVKQSAKVTGFADLKALKVGVQTGTTGDEVVSKLLGKTSTQVRRFESAPLAIKEMESGGVDAVVIDNGVLVNYAANNPASNLRMVNDPAFQPERYGIAVRKGHADLLAKLNKGLADVRADGTYDRIYASYFGKSPSDSGTRK